LIICFSRMTIVFTTKSTISAIGDIEYYQFTSLNLQDIAINC